MSYAEIKFTSFSIFSTAYSSVVHLYLLKSFYYQVLPLEKDSSSNSPSCAGGTMSCGKRFLCCSPITLAKRVLYYLSKT